MKRPGSRSLPKPKSSAAATSHGYALERLGQAKKFVDGVLGADKYQHYLEHHERNHPGAKPMTEREFWKDYTDWQEKNPEGRCC